MNKIRLAATTAICCALIVGSVMSAPKVKQETVEIDIESATELDISIDFGAGELNIQPGEIVQAAILSAEYDPRKHELIADYFVNKETGVLELESLHRKSSSLKNNTNEWDLTLSTKYPMVLQMSIGACEAVVDLGGLSIRELDINIGAASGDMEFSNPNPIRMREFSVDAGATSMTIVGIGNANFEEFNFSGGAGSFDLDFRGEYQGKSRIEIDLGVGSADIILPKGVAIEVETSGSNWLSSIDFHGDNLEEVDDDLYRSTNYESAVNKISLSIDVGLGSVDLFWK